MHNCSDPSCDRAAYIKGMCSMHYKRSRPRTPDKPRLVSCDGCGIEILRHKSKRYPKSYCSTLCSHWDQWGAWSEELPSSHWARMYGATSEWQPPTPKPSRLRFSSGTCKDCSAMFVELLSGVPSDYCSKACAKRTGKRRRRAREAGALGDFKWSDVLRQYVAQGKVCAYCRNTIDGMPDPEHVQPLSRGGRNDMSNIVASCRACNADKCDLTLSEWAEHRAERGLPPVVTVLTGDAYLNLFESTLQRAAWRDRMAS
jgi:hypothetical protein